MALTDVAPTGAQGEAVAVAPEAAIAASKGESPLRLLPQVGIVAAAVAAYFGVRGATNSDPAEAVRNAGHVLHLEKLLHLQVEARLQQDLAASQAVRTVLNWVYIWGHWPVVVVTLFWLARSHPEVFQRLRNAMMLSGAVGLVVFVLFPVAPPRLAGLDMADTVTLTSHAYRVLQPPMFTNQYAAVPSLHCGWNLLIGIAIVTCARHAVVRVIGGLMPAAMVVAVILTANHYVLDVFAGVALTTVAWYLCGRMRSPGRHRRSPFRRSGLRPELAVSA